MPDPWRHALQCAFAEQEARLAVHRARRWPWRWWMSVDCAERRLQAEGIRLTAALYLLEESLTERRTA